MNNIRYSFATIKYKNWVYALGGRIYGSDRFSLLKKCEYYDIKNDVWKKIADMNEKRCTNCGIIYNN